MQSIFCLDEKSLGKITFLPKHESELAATEGNTEDDGAKIFPHSRHLLGDKYRNYSQSPY